MKRKVGALVLLALLLAAPAVTLAKGPVVSGTNPDMTEGPRNLSAIEYLKIALLVSW